MTRRFRIEAHQHNRDSYPFHHLIPLLQVDHVDDHGVISIKGAP